MIELYQEYNPSPSGARVGDCAIRALSKALNLDWETAYTMLCVQGFDMHDMPNSKAVIDAVLTDRGFEREIIPNTCPRCYTVGEFAREHPQGDYVLVSGDHIVAVSQGKIWDTWDSSNEIPIYFYVRKDR